MHAEPHAPQLEAFFEQHVEPRLPALRARRRRAWVELAPLAIVPMVTVGAIGVWDPARPGWVVALGVILFIAFGIRAAILFARFQAAYKAVVVAPLMKQIDPASVYEPEGQLPQSKVTAARLLPEASTYKCEDVVRGQYGGSAFEFANIQLTSGSGKSAKVVFHGLFFQAADARPRQGTTVVVPSGREPYTPDADDGPVATFHEVAFQDKALADRFDAFSTHREEAGHVLSPPVMAALVALSQQLDGDVFASFAPGTVSLAARIGDFFEPGFAGPLVTKADVVRMATIVSTARRIAWELGVTGDAHFAHALVPQGRDDEPVHAHPAAPAFGTVHAAPAFGAGFVNAPSLQPLVERLRSRGYGVTLVGHSSLTLEFSTSIRMFLALLVPAFWTLVGIAVHDRATEWPAGGTFAEPLVAVVPIAGDALDWLVQFHPPLLAPLMLVVLLGLFNINRHYPRRIVLTPTGIERVGGLLPFARTRRVDADAGVSAVQGHVAIFKNLRRTVISPRLTPEEAEDLRQLVAGFRRAR